MVWLMFFINLAFSEYRAFELVIENQQTQQRRIVVSTLDPLQYPDYYPVSPNEIVMYQDTWMCYGNTSNKNICPNPRLVQNQVNLNN